jgi:hypothetical protein
VKANSKKFFFASAFNLGPASGCDSPERARQRQFYCAKM